MKPPCEDKTSWRLFARESRGSSWEPLEFRVLEFFLRYQQVAVPLENRGRLLLYRFVFALG